MRIRSFSIPITILVCGMILSCAGAPGVLSEAPVWVSARPEDTDTARIFRGEGQSGALRSARSKAIDNLGKSIQEAMQLGAPEFWNPDGAAAITELLDKLDSLVKGSDAASMDGVSLLRQAGWKQSPGTIAYVVDISWDKQAFENTVSELFNLLVTIEGEYKDFSDRAKSAESDGNLYEASLLWAAAAGVAQRNNNLAAFRIALDAIKSILEHFQFTLTDVPSTAYVGTRPSSPVQFTVSAMDRPVSMAEFVIGYPKKARDGSLSRLGGEARVLSDSTGVVRFLPPVIPFPGVQEITIALSANPFLEYLDDIDASNLDQFIKDVEIKRSQGEFDALPRTRIVPTGILILETDLAGNSLNSDDAARGLFDDLTGDGFDVDILNLSSNQIASRSELELLRDLKADRAVAGRFERVIHGTVTLESFEQSGDNYTVRVSGTIVLSDIQQQVSLYRSTISKTSQAADGQQAISAAFRQLGRSFAGELIKELP